ncbi:hypothetical protein LCGC14_2141090 [marine sediment metagenome]|uniref:Uncharacterized protein n=1 Tax=marine sediment metagenome TaxID=412755 RepID=A0A0F9GUP9_9ZZZZ
MAIAGLQTLNMGLKNATTLTISGGVVVQTQGVHIIAAQTGTTDDLDTITPATLDSGYRSLLLITADGSDTITLKNGAGNIACSTNKDITLDDEQYILLLYNGTNWVNINSVPQIAAYTPTNVTPDRSFDADTVAIAELADVVGTLIADLQSAAQIG